MQEKIELIGLSFEELEAELLKIGEKKFRAKQLWHWLYHQGAATFEQMTTLSKDLRAKLPEHFTLTRPKIVAEQLSKDKTRKWLLEFADGERVEMVYIPEQDRGAVCISTQVGCKMGCKFCHTGSQKFSRNLTAGEIISQFLVARDTYKEWPTPKDETRYLSNIVVMGMGEPLENFDNTIKALKILNDGEGVAISRRRITVSTSGIVPNIARLAEEIGCKLALSLHAPTDELRNKIMPINRKYPLQDVLSACQQYQTAMGNRHNITIEYLMLDHINDNLEDAKALVNLMKKFDLGVNFNLIPFNPWPGCPFAPSSNNRVHTFSKALENAGYSAPIRVARGQDILAACGQLKSEQESN